MEKEIRVITKVEQTPEGAQKLTKVIEFQNGNKVAIPINKDGSIKCKTKKSILTLGGGECYFFLL